MKALVLILTFCCWDAVEIVGENMITCVPVGGSAWVARWREVVAVGADPNCCHFLRCGRAERKERPVELANRAAWDMFYAGIEGIDWYLPGQELFGGFTLTDPDAETSQHSQEGE